MCANITKARLDLPDNLNIELNLFRIYKIAALTVVYVAGLSEEYVKTKEQDEHQRDLFGCKAQAPRKEGLNVDLHFGF